MRNIYLTFLFLFLSVGFINAQTRITGKVTDAVTGEPLGMALVSVPGTTIGATTNEDGEYTITVPTATTILSFSNLGYLSKDVPIGTRTMINVELEFHTTVMDQVVVTALGLRREEKALGYATQGVDGDKLSTVKGVSAVTSLSGQVSGMRVYNSTEFFTNPTMYLRGESSLLVVIDGVPVSGTGRLSELNADDIESIDVLKGATASALYGADGKNGAVMVTTKRAGKEKFTVDFNSSNMFFAGHLRIADPQKTYSSGWNGQYNLNEYVWGDIMDGTVTANQYDPIAQEWRDMPLIARGKNNYKNFLEAGIVSNTSVSVSQRGENGGFRASTNYVANKGQYPNALMQRMGFMLNGDIKVGKFSLDASMDFNKTIAPNISGIGYNLQGYIYQILLWTGVDYDIRDYKNNYWMRGKEGEEQNWHYDVWYDNPYLMAYEKLETIANNRLNAKLNMTYELTDWMKVMVRSGYEHYQNQTTKQAPGGIYSTRNWGGSSTGYYYLYNAHGYYLNNDAMLLIDKSFGDFGIDFVGGFSHYFRKTESTSMASRGGLSIPNYYSIYNSVESPSVGASLSRKGKLGLYGKLTVNWAGKIYVDITGRNDWSSTLPDGDNSYFYPSFAGSFILSEFFKTPDWLSFWKVRASWTVSKYDLDPYVTNVAYSTQLSQWDGNNFMYAPTSTRSPSVKPETKRSYELGTQAYFLNGKLKFDFTYFNELRYNRTASSYPSTYSGMASILTNITEDIEKRGFEITAEATALNTRDFKWNILANWSTSRRYYAKLDPEVRDLDAPWVGVGKRYDHLVYASLARDPNGNIINSNSGVPTTEGFSSLQGYSDPDWEFGITNTFTYKRFTVGIGIDGRIGGILYSSTDANMWSAGTHPDSDNEFRRAMVVDGASYVSSGVKIESGSITYVDRYGQVVDQDTRVFVPNDIETNYQTWARSYHRMSFNTYLNASYFKLRELSITYDIPEKIVNKIGMSRASISAIGQNLAIWTKDFRWVDPDGMADDLSSPSQRYVGFNLKFTF